MGKNNTISGVLVLAVILMIAASVFMVVNYVTEILTAAASFAASDQYAKLEACGVRPPIEMVTLQADIPALLLPAIYVGFPSLMIIISILMFIAGYYYGGGRESHSSETTTTTSSPNRGSSGKYEPGRKVEQTRTQKASTSEEK
jgi:hypothetical protein